jgi:hypothetical protein
LRGRWVTKRAVSEKKEWAMLPYSGVMLMRGDVRRGNE